MTHDDLLKLVDKATDTDRMFFERRRKRRFRVRRCHRAEIVQNALIEGKPPEVPPFELLATDYTWEVAERIAETVCREVAS